MSHDGAYSQGEFHLTLTVIDISAGWTVNGRVRINDAEVLVKGPRVGGSPAQRQIGGAESGLHEPSSAVADADFEDHLGCEDHQDPLSAGHSNERDIQEVPVDGHVPADLRAKWTAREVIRYEVRGFGPSVDERYAVNDLFR